MTGAIALLAFVTCQRLVELWIARRNLVRLQSEGAFEVGRAHYPWIVAMHAAWLAGLWWLAWNRSLEPLWLGAFAILQVLRIWVLATLGKRFTTRVLVVPGERLVRSGPYRFLRHPNYAVVVGEIAVLPLVFGLWAFAAVFSTLNLIALTVRIRTENRALAGLRRD